MTSESEQIAEQNNLKCMDCGKSGATGKFVPWGQSKHYECMTCLKCHVKGPLPDGTAIDHTIGYHSCCAPKGVMENMVWHQLQYYRFMRIRLALSRL